MQRSQLGVLSLSATDELLAAIFDDAPNTPAPAPKAARRDRPWPDLDMGALPQRDADDPAPRAQPSAAPRSAFAAVPVVRPVRNARRTAVIRRRRLRKLRAGLLTTVLALALGIGWDAGSSLYTLLAPKNISLSDSFAVRDVVERIIRAESHGDPNAKNPRSTAAGAAQFLDGTWLELVRAHRPDLRTLSAKETLDLRQDIGLAREMTARFAERNAAMLQSRGLPITPGSLYLAHFAGAAGAIALLSAADDASAATVMAKADATGRATREKIVQANPFLENFTVADIKRWADRKVRKIGMLSGRAAHGKSADQKL
ncbi:MAG: lytic transglycosylase domain-containing protein [Variibacter sp.]